MQLYTRDLNRSSVLTFIVIQQQVFGQEAFTAELSGENELPPVNTDANGTITIQGSNQSLNYQLALNGISNVTGAHIHFGNDAENGKIVITLLKPSSPSGLEVETLGGNFTDADVQGPLAGLPLEQLIGFMGNGSTYVNVHTTDFPLGEIRGQIEQPDVDEEERDEEGNEMTIPFLLRSSHF
ncbi:MAG: CHRD domain-containing protein [Nitrososphaeraceae archaeon]